MNYAEAEAYIHSFTRFGSQLGLDRMRKLLDLLGNPQDKLKFIHIAGTNGKGSTTKMSATILQEAGYRVGMYISPFVVDFRERFQINGKMIERSEFTSLVEEVDVQVRTLAEQGDYVTEFEVITAIAFLYFERWGCDIVALEVGLGGTYDATNVIRSPECAVITSISMDHVEILGDTLAKIAGEKAGIIKQGGQAVTYPKQEPEALAVLLERCAKVGGRLVCPNAAAVEILRLDVLGSQFRYAEEEYCLKLAGEHQVYNAVAVIEAMAVLRERGFRIPEEAVKTGLKKASFPARFEIMSQQPLIIVDGAHNRQAAESLADTLKRLDASPKVAIMGMMSDKDYESAVSSVAGQCPAILTVPVEWNPRALTAEALAECASRHCNRVKAFRDYREALEQALEMAGETGAVIACGSFYMASDMRKVIRDYLKQEDEVC